jgi:hypothetical protein
VTPVEVAVEVAVGDTLVVACGDAPVVGDETGGRVGCAVGDGLGVAVFVGDGPGVAVFVGDGLGVAVSVGDGDGDGDGRGFGDWQGKSTPHLLTAYEFVTTVRELIPEMTNSNSARTPPTTRRGVGQAGSCPCPLPRNCCWEEGSDLSNWHGLRLFSFISETLFSSTGPLSSTPPVSPQ